MTVALPRSAAWSTRYLLFIAGMGGLLYGIDVGIIAGAPPYLESTAALAWKLKAQQLSFIVAAVLLGSVLSSLFAGLLADLVGRRLTMVASGALFVASIPLIALADGYLPLLAGRLLQGVSGGLIGVSSNGMSVALLVNQFVSTSIAAVFLPTTGRHGYSTIFFFGAACTVVYFLASAFLLPETRGRTLEEIEGFFARPAAK